MTPDTWTMMKRSRDARLREGFRRDDPETLTLGDVLAADPQEWDEPEIEEV